MLDLLQLIGSALWFLVKCAELLVNALDLLQGVVWTGSGLCWLFSPTYRESLRQKRPPYRRVW